MNDLMGRPIEGEISHYTGDPPVQHDPQEFLDALDVVLDIEGVEAVRWNQYTPYFNDGEACVFNVYGSEVRIVGDDEDDEDADDWEGERFRDSYSLYRYGVDYRDKIFGKIAGFPAEPIFNALAALEKVLESGAHDIILSKKFGDPAQVTATKAGFSVEYYDHE